MLLRFFPLILALYFPKKYRRVGCVWGSQIYQSCSDHQLNSLAGAVNGCGGYRLSVEEKGKEREVKHECVGIYSMKLSLKSYQKP